MASLSLFSEPHLFRDIQAMESFGDFGSKVQTLVRHLLYLESMEPGTKSIVFSAWADSLSSKLPLAFCTLLHGNIFVFQLFSMRCRKMVECFK